MGSYDLKVYSLVGDDTPGDVPNFNETDQPRDILTTDGITGFDAADWTLNTSGFTKLLAGTFSLSQAGNDLILKYTAAVPEPSCIAMMTMLCIPLTLRLRKNV